METIYMNTGYGKIFNLHRLFLNLSDKKFVQK